jgi:hypothetical protein
VFSILGGDSLRRSHRLRKLMASSESILDENEEDAIVNARGERSESHFIDDISSGTLLPPISNSSETLLFIRRRTLGA